MYSHSTNSIFAVLASAIILLSGCSANTDTPSTDVTGVSDLSGEDGLIYSDGSASNTGTWVIYGHAEIRLNENIDLENLPADKGLSLVSPYSEEQLAEWNEGESYVWWNVTIAGGFDLNADSIGDIAIVPSGLAMHLLDSNEEAYMSMTPAKMGDIDNDGVDDLSVALSSGDARYRYLQLRT